MLKVISRILIILIAAGLVSGAIYLIFNNSSMGTFGGQFEGNRPQPGQQSAGESSNNTMPSFDNQGFQPGERPGGGRGGGHEGGPGGGGNAAGIWMNLGKVAGITLTIILMSVIQRKITKKKQGAISAGM